MSNFLSIHDTHRLPYNNATITAKTVQSGDTTPIKFYSGHQPDSEELGFEVFTNARGYLCDRSGNLYTDGVFVKEDAYITVTLGDGARTSWIVRSDSDTVVNDGKLLGKIVDDRSQWEEGREYVQFGGHWHLVLHSANTPNNTKLPMSDLADVPPINKWEETEQVTLIGPMNKSVTVEEYTKTLVLQWNGTKPETHEPVYVTVKTAVTNGRHRYAQHCLVYNQTEMRLTLIDESGKTIGSIAPTGTMNMGLFFLVDQNTGEWIEDDKLEDWDFGLDASNNGTSVEITGAPVGGFYTVELNDRTPNVLRIVAKELNFAGIQPYPREIPIKLVGNNLTKSRTIRLWFQNASENDGASLPAVFYETDANIPLCILYPATFCEIFVGEGQFTLDNAPMALDNSAKVAAGKATELEYYEPDFGRYKSLVGSGAAAVTRVLAYHEGIIRKGGTTINDVYVMGIDPPTFGPMVWMKDGLLNHHLYDYLNAMSMRENGILVSRNMQRDFGIQLGDSLPFYHNSSKSVRGVVCGYLDYFPSYNPTKYVENADGNFSEAPNYLIVANIDYLNSEDTDWPLQPYDVWIDAENGSDFIYDFIEEQKITLRGFKDTADQLIRLKNDPLFQGTNGVLTVSFVVALILCSAGFLIYWILSIKARSLQFGIYRAMGMTMGEILLMLFGEQIFISGTSIAAGILVGSLASKFYIPLIQIAYSDASSALPLVLVSDSNDLFRLLIVVGSVVLLCMVILGWLISKLKITQALKLGED